MAHSVFLFGFSLAPSQRANPRAMHLLLVAFSLASSTTQPGITRVDLVALLLVPSQNRFRNPIQTDAAR